MAIPLIKTAVLVLIRVEMLLLLVRAIMSWIPGAGGTALDLVVTMTEPVIYPVRLIVDRFTSKSTLPIDIAFIVTYLLLYLLELILSFS